MKKITVRRLCSAATAALIILALLTSLFYIVTQTDHDCPGENCAVCAVLALCKQIIGGTPLRRAFIYTAIPAFLLLCGFAAVTPPRAANTPVSMKIKLSD